MTDDFACLPDEIIANILNVSSCQETVVSFLETSKRLRRIASDPGVWNAVRVLRPGKAASVFFSRIAYVSCEHLTVHVPDGDRRERDVLDFLRRVSRKNAVRMLCVVIPNCASGNFLERILGVSLAFERLEHLRIDVHFAHNIPDSSFAFVQFPRGSSTLRTLDIRESPSARSISGIPSRVSFVSFKDAFFPILEIIRLEAYTTDILCTAILSTAKHATFNIESLSFLDSLKHHPHTFETSKIETVDISIGPHFYRTEGMSLEINVYSDVLGRFSTLPRELVIRPLTTRAVIEVPASFLGGDVKVSIVPSSPTHDILVISVTSS
jgi:hypothetical protein